MLTYYKAACQRLNDSTAPILAKVIHNFHPTVNETGSDHRPNSADVTLAMIAMGRRVIPTPLSIFHY